MWHAERCDLCGECLVQCQYVNYTREEAVVQIRQLIEGRAAEILKDCVTCCACNEYCPAGANPFDLINHLQEVHKSLPIPEKVKRFMDAGATVPSVLKKGDGSRPALSLCVMEPFMPKDAIGGQMFENMTIAKGGEYFCYLGYVHIGMGSPLEANAKRFVDSLASIGSEEVVLLHADCHAMISRMPDYGIKVPFKATHIVEYMKEYLEEHRAEIKPLGRRIAYQRPCASRYSSEVEPILDEMFGLMGVERVKRKYDRISARCCGGLFSRIYPERIMPMVKENIDDAVQAGAEALVFLCPLCMGALGKLAAEKGLRPIFITQLARMCLGELEFPA